MTLRTPRRRISPRTKRRYRAIRNFFKKALGSASQPDIHINSSITENVSDLKHKIIGLEQQLSEVSKHCRDIIRFESTSQQESRTFVSSEPGGGRGGCDGGSGGGHGGSESHGSRTEDGERVETKLLYKTSESQYRHSEGSDCILSPSPNDRPNVSRSCTRPTDCQTDNKTKKKKSKFDKRVNDFNMNASYSKNKTQHIAPYSTSSFHYLSEGNERRQMPANNTYEKEKPTKLELHNIRNQKHEHMFNEQSQRNYETFERFYEERQKKQNRNKKKKHTRELDQDFIADIIKRQYKPVKLFGRESDLSQVSEPVCRDHEFRLNENIKEDSEWCSCCHRSGRHLAHRSHRDDRDRDRDRNHDARSICDTRLYSTNYPRVKHHRHIRQYNDTELYDLIPVKEYSSPKTKRKSIQENIAYDYYKEVPPSPRSHRPRLNLKAQYYTTSEDHIDFMKNPRNLSPKRHKKYQKVLEAYDSDDTERPQKKHGRRTKQHLQKIDKNEQVQEDNITMTSLQFNALVDEPKNNADTSLNKTQETELSEDKTDRALCEIKDILQSFLQEIKKEASSQSGKSDVSTKVTDPCINNLTHNTQASSGLTPNSGHSFNYNIPQCTSYLPTFPNPCCYPMMPVCPMNCMQNGYVVPSPSFTCGNCSKKLDDTINKSTSSNEANETDELIKEIYKFVAQSPTFSRKQEDLRDGKITSAEPRLTSRSAGGSAQVCRHDANVGTPKIKSYSKSCEAIGSRMISDYSGTNASYSETILENVSLEATATTKSVSETDFSTNPSEKDKAKKSKFAGMLRSLGLLKKKKDAIEELNESDSSVEVELTRRPWRAPGEGGGYSPPRSPYHQQVTNYAMYEQQHYRPPPVQLPLHGPEYVQERAPPFNPAAPAAATVNNYHMPYPRGPYRSPHGMPEPHYYPGKPTAPPGPYANYDYNQPTQPPLCLKEIEVKSTATQSERKLGFFRKMKKKVQQPAQAQFEEQRQRSFSTQTAQPPKPIFNWKNFKAKDSPKYEDTNMMAYSFKTQKKLAEGDFKMRKTMLKKMFYKRNPFSPRNLIIKTLLGRDRASFGDPPTMYKPRMFL